MGLFLGIASLLAVARYFGASRDRDFFVVAMSVVTVLPMLVYGSLNEIFRAKFVHIRETLGLEKAVISARAAIFCISAISIVIIVLGEINAKTIAEFFLGAQLSHTSLRLVTLIRITLPIIFFTQLSAFWTQTLNCFNIYFIPEISALFSNVINIVIVVLLYNKIGIFALVFSSYTSAVLLTAVLVFIVRKKIPGLISLRIADIGGAKPYFWAALPFMFAYGIGQIITVFEKKISMGAGIGNVAILDYAQKLLSVPQGVIFSVAASILSPALAKHCANKNTADFTHELSSFYGFIFIVFAPCVFCMVFLPVELGNVLFAAKISVREIHTFGAVVMIFGFGLLGVMHYIIFSQVLVAQSKGLVVSIITLLNQAAILICNVLFAYKRGIQGLALSWAVWHILSGFALVCASGFFNKSHFSMILRLCGLYASSFLALWGINSFLPPLTDVLKITVDFIIFLSVMLIMMFVLRFEEIGNTCRWLLKIDIRNK
ncbi:MAG: hypothetical protein LBB74_03250 [Chitinispirillales bacterium]|nr:hypothetical protein [Chitinispirillales bacterium]